jgi:hypothetical protein
VGVGLMVGASAVGLAVALLLRARLPAWAVASMLSVCGGVVGAGALLVQEEAGAADWAVTVTSLCLLVPLHVRVMLGPLGRRPARSTAPGP